MPNSGIDNIKIELMGPFGKQETIHAYSVLRRARDTLLIIQHIFGGRVTINKKEEATYIVCTYGIARQSFCINGNCNTEIFMSHSPGETRVLFCNTAAFQPV